jgi:hypothetical protein
VSHGTHWPSTRLIVAACFSIKKASVPDFRAEAFNVFNRVRFGTGSLNIQDPTFGQLTSNGDVLNTPRQLQLGLKFYF